MTSSDCLAPGAFIDSDAPAVVAFAQRAAAEATEPRAAVLRLYAAVRDGIVYDPYVDLTDPANYCASTVLEKGRGFCVGKAALLAAAARSLGVPARVGFADVKNHLTSKRLYETMKTATFIWHSYAELNLGGKWVKATPAFDRALCERLSLAPLEFDGMNDSLFHPFDKTGQRHMEYLRDRGPYPDVPFETIVADLRAAYPHMMRAAGLAGEFRNEAVAEA
jgi:transglutaminase-like putative cysteine protease